MSTSMRILLPLVAGVAGVSAGFAFLAGAIAFWPAVAIIGAANVVAYLPDL